MHAVHLHVDMLDGAVHREDLHHVVAVHVARQVAQVNLHWPRGRAALLTLRRRTATSWSVPVGGGGGAAAAL